MLNIIWPLLILVMGLVVYALATNAKVAECGRIAYFCGLFVTVLKLADRALKL